MRVLNNLDPAAIHHSLTSHKTNPPTTPSPSLRKAPSQLCPISPPHPQKIREETIRLWTAHLYRKETLNGNLLIRKNLRKWVFLYVKNSEVVPVRVGAAYNLLELKRWTGLALFISTWNFVAISKVKKTKKNLVHNFFSNWKQMLKTTGREDINNVRGSGRLNSTL